MNIIRVLKLAWLSPSWIAPKQSRRLIVSAIKGEVQKAIDRLLLNPADKKVRHPNSWRGTKWVTLRETSTGLYPEVWFEIARNNIGDVTVIPAYAWCEKSQRMINGRSCSSLERKLSDLMTESIAVKKLSQHAAGIDAEVAELSLKRKALHLTASRENIVAVKAESDRLGELILTKERSRAHPIIGMVCRI